MVIYKVKRRIYGNAHCCYLPSNRQVISPRSVVLLWGTGIVSVDPGVIGDLGQLELDSPSRSEGMEPIFLGVGVCGSMRFPKRYSGIGTTWDIDGREFGDSAVDRGAEFLITLLCLGLRSIVGCFLRIVPRDLLGTSGALISRPVLPSMSRVIPTLLEVHCNPTWRIHFRH